MRTSADARLFELAAVFADQHSGDSLPRSRTVLPGMERAVQVGGTGTPHVAEFAMAELGARLQMSTWSARALVADALDVRHRLPRIWARVTSGEARVGNARLVAVKTRHLSMEAAARVDAAMTDFVDGSLTWGRFQNRLDGKVVAADPEAAAAREAAAAEEQYARRSRSSEHGTAVFIVRSTAGVIARLDATVAFLADALLAVGDQDREDLRRVKAIALLANPVRAVELLAAFAAQRSRTVDVELPEDEDRLDQLDQQAEPGTGSESDAMARMYAFASRVGFTPTWLPDWLTVLHGPPDGDPPGRFTFDWSALLPPLTMYLHLDADTLGSGTGGVARWEGEGPVTHAFVHEHLRPLHRYVIKPVIDLAHQAPADAYEIPDRLREGVRLMAPTDIFPFACASSRRLDVDHTVAYGAEGRTRLGNLGPLSRLHHRIKTHGRWTVRQPFEGIYVWRDPHGRIYVVDHGGTHPVSGTDADLDVYPTDTVVHVDFGAPA